MVYTTDSDLRSDVLGRQWRLSVLILAVFWFSAGRTAHAQTSQVAGVTSGIVTNITSTPAPASGHAYLHDLSEVVNPANGALSIRIEVPRPHERALNNIPLYAFMYDSDTEYQVNMWEQEQNCYDSSLNSDQDRTTTCVAAVVQPQLNNREQTESSFNTWNIGPNTLTHGESNYTWYVTNVMIANCDVLSGYVYEDAWGVRHPLNINAVWHGNSNAMGSDQDAICLNNFNISSARFGGDRQYKAFVGGWADPTQGQATVTDAEGDALASQGSLSPLIDANGNCVNGTGRSGSYLGYMWKPDPGQVDCTASSGQQYLSGSLQAGTYTIKYPGIANPYSYTVGPTTMTYAIGYQDITPVGDPLCGGNTQQAGSNSANSFAGSFASTQGNYSPLSLNKYTAIGLPNGLSYQLTYDPVYGYINKITYPTGAWVQYTWGVNANSEMMGYGPAWDISQNIEPVAVAAGQYMNTSCWFRHDFPAIQKRVVSYDGVHPAQEQDFTYTTTWPDPQSPNWTSKQTTVTTTDLIRPGHPSFQTIYTYHSAPITPSFGSHVITSGMPMEDSIVYKDVAGNVIKTIQKVWTDNSADAQLAGECEVLPNGSTKGTFYQYATYAAQLQDTYNAQVSQTDAITDVAEYDFGALGSTCSKPSATASRETVTTYASFGAPLNWPTFQYYQNAQMNQITFPSLWAKPDTVKVYDHGALAAETNYGYDETAVGPVAALNGSSLTNFGTGSAFARGNTTTITKRCFVGALSCQDETTKIAYDGTGQPSAVTDGNNHTTYLSYADSYTTDDGAPSGSTNTYVTQITRPPTGGVPHISSYSYGFNQGLLRQATDENGQVSKYQYNDPWNRLTEADFPDGGQTGMVYNDGGPSPTVQTTTLLNQTGSTGALSRVTTDVMDGFGRTIQTQTNSDSNGVDYVDTVYDGLGLPYTVSNPRRTAAASTDGTTTFTYDSLGRTVIQQRPDGATSQYCYDNIAGEGQTNCNAHIVTGSGTWVDVADENGNDWQRTSDAFGHLTSVVEPGGLKTTYKVDVLGNILCVDQWGTGSINASCSSSRNRAFSYDSLSRLLTSANPEVGTICYGQRVSGSCLYGYDGNGNVRYKTDARGILTTYSYDALSRVLSKVYSDGTPSSCFTYDTTPVNGTGRLAAEWTQKDSCAASPTNAQSVYTVLQYDAMGRIAQDKRCTGNANCATSVYRPMSYSYDLVGHVTSYGDGIGGRSFTVDYDAVGRLLDLKGGVPNAQTPLFVIQNYGPLGWTKAAVSSGMTSSRNYDNRSRLTGETVTRP